MPSTVTSIHARKQGFYVVLEAHVPGRAPQNIGVYLVDAATDRLWLRLRDDFEDLAEGLDLEVLQAMEEDLRSRTAELGAEAVLQGMEDSLSNFLRIGERRSVEVDAFARVLERLYDRNVAPVQVERFRTHLPLYSLQAAAGGLGEEMESNVEDWVRPPEGMRLDPGMFVAHVIGRSMEPLIPDGSLNVFRFHPVGSRQNKILLIQRFGVGDETARYTVKKYTSRKVQDSEEEWHHEQIRLEPLNAEFEGWDLGPEDFTVVAEWLRVLE